MSYDAADKVLFSADGFGKFGALDAEEAWDDEARRYYIGIVGKYGMQVQKLLQRQPAWKLKPSAPSMDPSSRRTWGITSKNTTSGLPIARRKRAL